MKISLDLTADLTPVESAFSTADTLIKESDNAVKKFGNDAKTAYSKAWKETQKYDQEIENATKSMKNLEQGNKVIGVAGNKIKELRKEIKQLQSDAIKLQEQGDLIGANAAIKKAGELKDELADINDAVKSVSGNARENMARAFGTATSLISQGFEGATAAANLLGVESKDVEKQILRLQSIQSISRIAGDFADVKDRIREIKLGLAPLKEGLSSFLSAPIAGFKTLFALIRANPIGAFIAVVAALGTAFVFLKDKLNLFGEAEEKAFKNSIKNAEENLNVLKSQYEYIIAIAEASGRNTTKIEELSFKEQKKFLNDKLTEIENYRRRRKDLSEEELETEKKLMKEYEDLLAARNIADAKRIVARQKYEKEYQNSIRESEIASIKDSEQREIAQAKFKKQVDLDSVQESLKALYTEEEQKAILNVIRRNNEEELQREILAIQKKYAEERLQKQKEYAEVLFGLQQRLQAKTEEERIEKEKQAALHELENLKQEIIKRGKAVNEGYKLSAEQLDIFQKLEQQIYQKSTEDLIQLAADRQKQVFQSQINAAESNLKTLEALQEAEIQGINGMLKPNGLSEAQFEEAKQIKILEIQKKYIDKRLALTLEEAGIKYQAQVKATEDEISLLEGKEGTDYEIRRKAANERLKLLEQEYNAQIELNKKTFGAQGAEIQNQINKIQGNVKPLDINTLLGITPEQGKALIDLGNALKTSFTSTISTIVKAIDAELNTLDESIQESQKTIDDIQNKIQDAQRLKEQGLANNLDALQKQLDNEKKINEEQLKQQDELLEKKRQAAKAQLAIDSITQASNLTTAISNIYAGLTKIDPSGITATLAAAALISSFLFEKAAALDAINKNQFAEGVIDLQGPGTSKSDSIPARLSKGESVMTAEETADNKSLFKGIRNNDQALIRKGIFDLLENTGVKLLPDFPSILANKRASVRNEELNSIVNDYSSLEQQLKTTNETLQAILSSSSEKIYTDAKGNVIIKKGNNITTLRKNG